MPLTTRNTLTVAVALMAATGLAACGGTSSGSGTGSSSTPMSSAPMTTASNAGLVGPGCADYAKAVPSGAGSVDGMAQDPVATAASNNPLLTTLTKAVSGQLNKKVDLVDTLNSGEFTVFAPVDDAFAAVPKKTLNGIVGDSKTLTSVLTYHVVSGQLAPDAIDGSHDTVQGEALKVTGSGDSLKVNGANVICGGVKTANATVYLIDQVLTPPSMS
ncbi:fasciclin domain-containing protein [Spongisporangium articulatum]|uniref:Fasciclin domain-containing protein n=1 Tax=Spongisporangium articulatum TaxID=3362603 RepID=A0ABW8ANL0_9ACTN